MPLLGNFEPRDSILHSRRRWRSFGGDGRVPARDGGGEVAADGGGGRRLRDRPAASDNPLLTQAQEEGGRLSAEILGLIIG